VYEREKAQVVTIVEGDDAKAIDIYVPEMKDVVDVEEPRALPHKSE